MPLTKDEITKRPRQIQTVTIDGLGDVCLLKLTLGERNRIFKLREKFSKETQEQVGDKIFLAICLADENGKRLFTATAQDPDQADFLAAGELASHLEASVSDALVQKALEINGMLKKPEDQVKN